MNAPIREYLNQHYQDFVEDMNDAGLNVEKYNGRFFYYPAVKVEKLQDALSKTKVPVPVGQNWSRLHRLPERIVNELRNGARPVDLQRKSAADYPERTTANRNRRL